MIFFQLLILQIFSKIVTGRIVFFGMQASGFLFTLTNFDHPKQCPVVFLSTIMLMMEVTMRFLLICIRGENLYNAVSFVVLCNRREWKLFTS